MENMIIFDILNDTKLSQEQINQNINSNEILTKLDNMKIEYDNKILELNNKLNITNEILNKTLIELENIKKNIKNDNVSKNNNKNNKQKSNKIFKSASLTFIDDELGYLFCNEYRYKEKSTLIHPIGGKVETFDKGLIETAIREFVEETNLEQYPYINIDKTTKNKLIENIKLIIGQDIQFYDFCVGKELGYYHRYYYCYLKNIKDDEFKKSIRELPIFFNGNFKTEVDSLEWIRINHNTNEEINSTKKKFSHLTKMFLKYKH